LVRSDSRQEGETFDVACQLAFRPNPQETTRPDRTDWIAEHDGNRVLSSNELDALITNTPGLFNLVDQGEPIWVGLRERKMGLRRNPFFHAFPLSGTVPQEVLPVRTISPTLSGATSLTPPEAKELPVFRMAVEGEVQRLTEVRRRRRVAVFIDGQNFLFALQQLDVIGNPQIITVLQKILAFHHAGLVNFCICQEVEPTRLNPLVNLLQASVRGIRIVNRPMKVIRNSHPSNNVYKSDVDGWLIPGLVAAFYEQPGLEGVVLVAGDSDYFPALERCWLSKDLGGPKHVEVVSSQKTVARNYRGHPNITLRFLEDLI